MSHVLFVCLHNAGRSQMSQALFERAAGGRHTADSAGSVADPAGRVHPEVVTAMAELDYDVSDRRPQKLTRALGARVQVSDKGNGKGGTIEIHYASLDDLDRILEKLYTHHR